MIRRWLVEPDPELGIVTEHQLATELVKAATIMDKMGGHLRVTTQRQRSSQVPGEAFTVGAVIEWVDRTDDARLVPEQEAQPVASAAPPPPVSAPAPPAESVSDEPAEQLVAEEERAAAARAAFESEGDGIIVNEETGEPEEDLTSIPAGLR